MFLLFASTVLQLTSATKADALRVERGQLRVDDPDTIRFYLFSSDNPWNDALPFNGAEVYGGYGAGNVTGSKYFKASRPTKFLIHGFNSEGLSFAEPFIKSYLQIDDVNIITMDWHVLAGVHWDIYTTAARQVLNAADHAAIFINSWIWHYDVKPADIHLIGHSLGGQVAGRLARDVESTQGSKIGRLSGLDPAGPLFVDDELSSECLKKEDAAFVDVIHTNGGDVGPFVLRGLFGNLNPMGHIDFFVNGGSRQPGCWNLIIWAEGACSHMRAPELYAESIMRPDSFASKECKTTDPECWYGTNVNGPEVIHMGQWSMKEAPDDVLQNPRMYYLETNSEPPYSLSGTAYELSRAPTSWEEIPSLIPTKMLEAKQN